MTILSLVGRRLSGLLDIMRLRKDLVFAPLLAFLPQGFSPNQITFFRSALLACWLPFALLRPAWWQLGLFAFIFFLDLVDGTAARRIGPVTRFGEYFDHISDKFNNIAAILVIYGLTGRQFVWLLVIIGWELVVSFHLWLEYRRPDGLKWAWRAPFELLMKLSLWLVILFQVWPII